MNTHTACLASLLPLLWLAGCDPATETGRVTAYELQTLADGVGGPKALARPAEGDRPADFILANDRIQVSVLGGHVSMGPGIYGGSIADADRVRRGPDWANGVGNDRLAEIIPTVNLNVPGAVLEEHVEIIRDGSDGEAIIRVSAAAEPFLGMLQALWSLLRTPDFHIVTDYVLKPDSDYVLLRTTATVMDDGITPATEGELLAGSDDFLAVVDLALGGGIAIGDFYLQGGDVDVFVPGIGFDEDTEIQVLAQQGRNLMTEPLALDFVAGTSEGVSYVLGAIDGSVHIPLFTSSQTVAIGAGVEPACEGDTGCEDAAFEAGTAVTYERAFAIGHGDVGSALDGLYAARGTPVGRVDGFVVEESTVEPASGAKVFVYEPGAERPYSQWTTDVMLDDTLVDGNFGGTLPVGPWELVVHEQGRQTSGRTAITVTEDEPVAVVLTARRSGDVTFTVRDDEGLLTPSKVTVYPATGQSVVRDPVLGDPFLPDDPEAIVFLAMGEGSVQLPPGDYEAWATRGLEYELDVEPFTVRAGQASDVQLAVARSIDSSGWISADFHVHSQPSHDSGVSPTERVVTMAAEGVEFLLSTDHDFILDFAPHIEDLGLEPWITSSIGLEVTPIEVGHYLGFPLRQDYLDEAGGAFDWTGMTPREIRESLIDAGQVDAEVTTIMAHPRDGILGYFDQFGFSPYEGEPYAPVVDIPVTSTAADFSIFTPAQFDLDFHAIEILNGKRFELIRTPTQQELDDYAAGREVTGYDVIERTLDEQADLEAGTYTLGYGIEGHLDDWFSLLNLGYRLTALGNSDAHGKTKVEAGCPRNYVLSGTDEPAYVDDAEVALAVREHRVVASYGPFIRFWADDPDNVVGSEIVADGAVALTVEVQSPTWFDVDRVEVYENGRLIHVWDGLAPNSDVLNLFETLEVTPTQDSWYVVTALSDDSLTPLFSPVVWPAIQLQDVVIEALGSVEAIGSLLGSSIDQPRTFPTHPYALTNPIWVDVDGDGWEPPGLPDWLQVPVDPSAEE